MVQFFSLAKSPLRADPAKACRTGLEAHKVPCSVCRPNDHAYHKLAVDLDIQERT